MSQEKVKCRYGHESTKREMQENGCYQCQVEEIEERAKNYYCPYCGKQSNKKLEDGDEGYIEISCKDCKSPQFRIYESEDGSDDEIHELTTDEITEEYRKQIEGF